MSTLPITRVVLYKHGVGYFEREGTVEGDATLALTFKQSEVSDVLKSLTVLDLAGGHVASVSYDSTKPLEQLLADVALSIPDQGSLVGLIPQIKGARVALHTGVDEPLEGSLLGIDTTERQTGDGIVHVVLVSVLTDGGEVRSFDLHGLAGLKILDAALRRDLDYYLKTQLSAKKKDARTFTFFAQGEGKRTVRLSYTLEAPVWKATYRIILGEEEKPPMIQGWAVVDNTQDEDWENVELSLIAGLPVSFVHDLYTPRYIRRPEVKVQETTGVLPPVVEEGMMLAEEAEELDVAGFAPAAASPGAFRAKHERMMTGGGGPEAVRRTALSSTPAQVRERKLGDLFAYDIEHPVTIRRNQSALVPIVLRPFEGRPVLLYNKATRAENPMRCVEFKNTTGLTLEGGPVTVLEGGNYVGEAMLETLKPDEQRLVPYAVELGVSVLDNIDSHEGTVNRVVIRNRILTTYRTQVQQTTYSFNNKSDIEQKLYLDHARPREWELYETPEPNETTENYWRFRFALPAHKVGRFVVRQRFTSERTHSLLDLAENRELGYWIEQRFFDANTAQVLREVVEQRQQAARLEEQIVRLQQERENIHNEQKRIRENLQALGDRSAEKELRERFVRALNSQEDRLEKIEREIVERTAARDRCHETISELLGKLEYDATLSAAG
ncbi:MAG TPA: hypothetical protein VEL76_23910 [Gemmataceae bacterium]|nr:hypothetical protein [Gemmataceae bacterium]